MLGFIERPAPLRVAAVASPTLPAPAVGVLTPFTGAAFRLSPVWPIAALGFGTFISGAALPLSALALSPLVSPSVGVSSTVTHDR